MNKRDLHADLAICNAATPGPWLYDAGDIVSVELDYESVDLLNPYDGAKDARFIAAARTGWPHAIERAMAAEAEVERLRGNCQALFDALMEALKHVPGEWSEECHEIVARLRADIYGEEVSA